MTVVHHGLVQPWWWRWQQRRPGVHPHGPRHAHGRPHRRTAHGWSPHVLHRGRHGRRHHVPAHGRPWAPVVHRRTAHWRAPHRRASHGRSPHGAGARRRAKAVVAMITHGRPRRLHRPGVQGGARGNNRLRHGPRGHGLHRRWRHAHIHLPLRRPHPHRGLQVRWTIGERWREQGIRRHHRGWLPVLDWIRRRKLAVRHGLLKIVESKLGFREIACFDRSASKLATSQRLPALGSGSNGCKADESIPESQTILALHHFLHHLLFSLFHLWLRDFLFLLQVRQGCFVRILGLESVNLGLLSLLFFRGDLGLTLVVCDIFLFLNLHLILRRQPQRRGLGLVRLVVAPCSIGDSIAGCARCHWHSRNVQSCYLTEGLALQPDILQNGLVVLLGLQVGRCHNVLEHDHTARHNSCVHGALHECFCGHLLLSDGLLGVHHLRTLTIPELNPLQAHDRGSLCRESEKLKHSSTRLSPVVVLKKLVGFQRPESLQHRLQPLGLHCWQQTHNAELFRGKEVTGGLRTIQCQGWILSPLYKTSRPFQRGLLAKNWQCRKSAESSGSFLRTPKLDESS
mmetsp:Transcript_18177/g.43760  ORF Transcript_18177/g.43760 Transcript_18177/m.43760 type:complete len:568 (+) Transcript_18177:81-1784(+)